MAPWGHNCGRESSCRPPPRTAKRHTRRFLREQNKRCPTCPINGQSNRRNFPRPVTAMQDTAGHLARELYTRRLMCVNSGKPVEKESCTKRDTIHSANATWQIYLRLGGNTTIMHLVSIPAQFAVSILREPHHHAAHLLAGRAQQLICQVSTMQHKAGPPDSAQVAVLWYHSTVDCGTGVSANSASTIADALGFPPDKTSLPIITR